MNYCPKCGSSVDERSSRCSGCGTVFNELQRKSSSNKGASHPFIFIVMFLAAFVIMFVALNLDNGLKILSGASGLEIISDSSVTEGNFRYVTGEIKNISKDNYKYVQVEINLYNGDNLVGSTMDNINNLNAGEIWKFKAPVLNEEAETYKIVDVTGF